MTKEVTTFEGLSCKMPVFDMNVGFKINKTLKSDAIKQTCVFKFNIFACKRESVPFLSARLPLSHGMEQSGGLTSPRGGARRLLFVVSFSSDRVSVTAKRETERTETDTETQTDREDRETFNLTSRQQSCL